MDENLGVLGRFGEEGCLGMVFDGDFRGAMGGEDVGLGLVFVLVGHGGIEVACGCI